MGQLVNKSLVEDGNISSTIIFMAGVPGAGKTTLARERYTEFPEGLWKFIDFHLRPTADFDPELDLICGNTTDLVEKFVLEVLPERSVAYMYANYEGFLSNWIFDGSEIPTGLLIDLIRKCRKAGLRTKVVYVLVDPEVAIERNENRPPETKVHPADIRSRAANDENAIDMLKDYAHEVEVVDNRPGGNGYIYHGSP